MKNSSHASQMSGTVPFDITLQQIKTDFKGEFCYVHARGAVTPEGFGIITTQQLDLQGSDIFFGLEMLTSTDRGENWSPIRKSAPLAREPYGPDCERVMCDGTPFYHRKSGKLLLTGHSAVYSLKQSLTPLSAKPRHTLWSVFDPEKGDWAKFRELEMPEGELFFNCGSGCCQIWELPDGDLLIPVYAAAEKELREGPVCFKSLMLKCSFDGEELKVKEIGPPLTVDIPRGFCEPSVVFFENRFYLALRNDKKGFITRSDNGLDYSEPRVLCFDDGEESGNYCTQQHWVKGGGRLYLVYTRRGAGNDHVFRHRAPLFMAEVDPERLCLLRSTERIVVPERGARLGNFGCTQISDDEAWVIAAEWMQTTAPDYYNCKRCMSYGSDNSIWIAKINFANS